MIPRLAILLLAATLAAPLEAQRAPRRPRLAAEADTNDANAYFQLGLTRLERDPGTAEAAFYWAARLDPMSPQALYAEAVAALLRDPGRLVRHLQRDTRTLAAPAVLAIDSLRFRAEMQDPFLHRGMDEMLLFAFVKAAPRRDEFLGTAGSAPVSSNGSASTDAGQRDETERYLERNDPYARGQLYYSQGQLRDALQYWAIAMRTHVVDWVWADRARAWVELRQLDSAAAAMREAIRARRGSGDDTPRHVYESSAAWQFALGRILEDRHDTAAAREAYAAAAAADPAYYPATLRLAVLSLQSRDTASASAALDQVVQRPDVQFFACAVAATILDRIGRRDAAVAALRRATDIEPAASAGWLMLARALDAGHDAAAAEAYQRYLALAPRNDIGRGTATAALARLRGTSP